MININAALVKLMLRLHEQGRSQDLSLQKKLKLKRHKMNATKDKIVREPGIS